MKTSELSHPELEELVPLTKRKVPTIVGYDMKTGTYTIGDEARLTGLSGKTTVFNFKTVLGAGDKEFAKDKKFWYWVPFEDREHIETFTAKEAASRYLQTLFKATRMPGRIIVGEPAIRDQAWKENFRRHMREIFSDLGLQPPEFFPEPFAVFQYYRHVDRTFPMAKNAEIVLIIDVGGGTFNSCMIRTTEQGLLARGGATAVPLGLQAAVCGGSLIDKELLKVLIRKSRPKTVWKEDPIARLEAKATPALLRAEDAKIRLSEEMALVPSLRLSDDCSRFKVNVFLPKGELHPETDIKEVLDGEDLKAVIRDMWRRHYSKIIADTVNEAREKLASAQKIVLDRIDKVIVAGGSSRLPFLTEEIYTLLPTLVNRRSVFIGKDIGEAVAYGIACECREQAKRDPSLSAGRIAPCILNDLYLGIRQSRRDRFSVPHIREGGQLRANGHLLFAPFETEQSTFNFELELPFDVNDRVFYAFSDKPLEDEDASTALNTTHDVFSVPKLKKISRKCYLTLDIQPSGNVKPTFTFHGKGSSIDKLGQSIVCPEFYFSGFQSLDGTAYVGFDFGNSNSYLVQFASIPKAITGVEYPLFTLSSSVKDRLRELELRLQTLQESGVISKPILARHAKNQTIEVVFHSNKIEGSPLSKGETEEAVNHSDAAGLSESELEASNLEIAYSWMLDNFDSVSTQPEGFIRELNKLILKNVKRGGGEYRATNVSLAGVEFVPPDAASIGAFMHSLGQELLQGKHERSALEFAVSAHTKLVWIHPFVDGNGRTARLLLNACMLFSGLPVVVVNYADRERYLHCLKESNGGDLSPLVEFLIECLEEQISELQRESSPEIQVKVEPDIPQEPISIPDAIDKVIKEIRSSDEEDVLSLVMKEKVGAEKKNRQATYEAWKQSFLTVSAELKAIAERFEANEDYRQAGFGMQFQGYDVLAYEKYEDIAYGKGASRTWFVGVEINGPTGRQKVLFFFGRASLKLAPDNRANKVALILSRYDGARYQRLESEPISLREIGYREGELVFMHADGGIHAGSVRQSLTGLLAEVIKSYL